MAQIGNQIRALDQESKYLKSFYYCFYLQLFALDDKTSFRNFNIRFKQVLPFLLLLNMPSYFYYSSDKTKSSSIFSIINFSNPTNTTKRKDKKRQRSTGNVRETVWHTDPIEVANTPLSPTTPISNGSSIVSRIELTEHLTPKRPLRPPSRPPSTVTVPEGKLAHTNTLTK